jgi:5-(carboxyamino)imidazole ribonucleotide synthase
MRIGILGGGQLAQMLTQAAISLGLETAIYDIVPDTPASRLTHRHVVGAWDDLEALRAFAAHCDVLTLENEFVLAGPLQTLEDEGVRIYPRPSTLATIQDKLHQKDTMAMVGIPVPAFRAVESMQEVQAAAERLGYPLVLKARYGGYDGYGNAVVHTPDDIGPAWEKLARSGRQIMAEAWVPFEKELAVMVVRRPDQDCVAYPVVETVQQNHICHVVRAPAAISPVQAARATEIACRAVEVLDGVGVFGVELFVLPDGQVMYNEIAPRPHNSGHYSIEGCVTSQFENHLRAVMDWPLGSVALRAPAAVMVNVLGRRSGPLHPQAVAQALSIENAHLHVYGKREVRVGRKMAHVTVLGQSVEQAEAQARAAADLLDL